MITIYVQGTAPVVTSITSPDQPTKVRKATRKVGIPIPINASAVGNEMTRIYSAIAFLLPEMVRTKQIASASDLRCPIVTAEGGIAGLSKEYMYSLLIAAANCRSDVSGTVTSETSDRFVTACAEYFANRIRLTTDFSADRSADARQKNYAICLSDSPTFAAYVADSEKEQAA